MTTPTPPSNPHASIVTGERTYQIVEYSTLISCWRVAVSGNRAALFRTPERIIPANHAADVYLSGGKPNTKDFGDCGNLGASLDAFWREQGWAEKAQTVAVDVLAELRAMKVAIYSLEVPDRIINEQDSFSGGCAFEAGIHYANQSALKLIDAILAQLEHPHAR